LNQIKQKRRKRRKELLLKLRGKKSLRIQKKRKKLRKRKNSMGWMIKERFSGNIMKKLKY